VTEGVGPEFKPQYQKKKIKRVDLFFPSENDKKQNKIKQSPEL
jgi:hypothetical protein